VLRSTSINNSNKDSVIANHYSLERSDTINYSIIWLVSLDAQEGKVVTFGRYAKDDEIIVLQGRVGMVNLAAKKSGLNSK
jgi:hypothetical protein